MHPILFTLGPVTLYTYGAMMVAAFLATTWLSGHRAQQLPKNQVAITAEQLVDFACWALVGGIIGGRLLYVLLNLPLFLQMPWEVFALWHGGLIWYGGFLGGLVGAGGYIRRMKLPWFAVLDQFVPFLALGHAIGRIGCFFNGCCYGKPSQGWCAVWFPGHDQAVLPTQLFEALGLCFLFLGLRFLQARLLGKPPTGRVFGAYLAGYGLLRFGLEYTRGDQPVLWAGLTLQQIISLALVLSGTVLIFQLPQRRENKNRPR